MLQIPGLLAGATKGRPELAHAVSGLLAGLPGGLLPASGLKPGSAAEIWVRSGLDLGDIRVPLGGIWGRPELAHAVSGLLADLPGACSSGSTAQICVGGLRN